LHGFGGAREAAGVDDLDKDFHRLQFIHSAILLFGILNNQFVIAVFIIF
jgi:hypothetical protein